MIIEHTSSQNVLKRIQTRRMTFMTNYTPTNDKTTAVMIASLNKCKLCFNQRKKKTNEKCF